MCVFDINKFDINRYIHIRIIYIYQMRCDDMLWNVWRINKKKYAFLPSAPTGIVVRCVRLSVRLSARPKRRYGSKSFRILSIGLKISWMIHSAMKQINV